MANIASNMEFLILLKHNFYLGESTLKFEFSGESRVLRMRNKTKDVKHKLSCTVKIRHRQLETLDGQYDIRCESTKCKKGGTEKGME